MSKFTYVGNGVMPVLPTYNDPVDIPTSFNNYARSIPVPGTFEGKINSHSSDASDWGPFNSFGSPRWDSNFIQSLSVGRWSSSGNSEAYSTGWRDRFEIHNDALGGSQARPAGMCRFSAGIRYDSSDYSKHADFKWTVRGTEWLNNGTTGTAYHQQGTDLTGIEFGRSGSKWIRFEVEFFYLPYRDGGVYEGKISSANKRIFFRANGENWDGGSNYRQYVIHGVGACTLDYHIIDSALGYEGHDLNNAGNPRQDYVNFTRDWRTITVGD